MLNTRYNLKGMTLVEIMVALAIVFILFATAAPNFSAWIQNTKVHTSAESILNGISMAKNEAVHRNATSQFISCGGASWEVLVVSGAASANVCAASAPSAGWELVQTQVEPNGSQALVDPAQVAIAFSGLGRQANTTNAATGAALAPANVDIDVSYSLNGPSCFCPGGNCNYTGQIPFATNGKLRCLRIKVSSGGQIRMCDPALNIGTPQGC